MLSKLKRRLKIRSKNKSRFELEKLDSRLLLSATAVIPDCHDHNEDFSDFIRDGYGMPDAFYSDPSTWALDSSDGATFQDAIVSDSADNDLFGTLDSSDISEGDSHLGSLLSKGSYTLFLDFDGAHVKSRSSDFWLGSSYVDIPAYDLGMFDWGGREAESIEIITAMVQEDYAAYNVSVTTTEPTYGDYTTLYVGGDNSWFRANSNVIGVATYDVGNYIDSNYGFAFTEELEIYKNYSNGSLHNFSEYIANLVTHEAAHTFGANHVNDTSALMNPYLPINPRISSFGGDNSQDTQSLLGSNVGYAHGPDDYGDGFTNSEPISLQGVTNGILETRDDKDTFNFTSSFSGAMGVDLDTTAYGNLDSYLKVYKTSSQSLVNQNDNYMNDSDSYVTWNVESGVQYTIEVSSKSSNSSGTYSLEFDLPNAEPDIEIADQSGSSSDGLIDFGTLEAGTSSTSTFIITNNGLADLTVSQLSTSSPFALDIVSDSGDVTDDLVISPGESQTVTVSFESQMTGTYSGVVVISSNDESSPETTLDLMGTLKAPMPDMEVSQDGAISNDYVIDFGNITRNTIGYETVTISNSGLADLVISDAVVLGGFEIDESLSWPQSIAPGNSVDITVQVSGDIRQEIIGSLTVSTNDQDDPEATIILTAQITAGDLTVSESYQVVNDNQIDFGTVYQGENIQKTVTIINTGDDILTISNLAIDPIFTLDTGNEYGINGIQLEAGESIEILAGYSPQATGEVSGELIITSDDLDSPVTVVDLMATGDSNSLEIIETDGVHDGLVDAGRLRVGEFYIIDLWTLANHGNEPVNISVDFDDQSGFRLVGSEYFTIPAGGDYDVRFVIDTDNAMAISDTITLTADDYYTSTDTISVSAEPFALVGGRDKYSFIDNDGDKVTISMGGDGTAEVTLGQAGQPDIKTIELKDGVQPGKLNIKVKGDGGTQLGELTGTGDLKSFIAKDVELVGSGIDIDGSIGKLKLAGILSGAGVSYDAQIPTSIQVEHIGNDSTIDIDGQINKVKIGQFDDGLLKSDQINKILIDQMSGDIEVTNGDLNSLKIRQGGYSGQIDVNGSLNTFALKSGDLSGKITVADDIGKLLLSSGDIDGNIKSGEKIGVVKAQNMNQASIYAKSQIDKILLSEDMKDSTISIGYDADIPMDAQSAAAIAPVNAYMGMLNIKGTFESSTIAVGVAPGSDGTLINGIAHTSSGSIDKVKISNLNTDNQDNPFGLIARDSLGKLKINRQVIPSDYKSDDFHVTVINDILK